MWSALKKITSSIRAKHLDVDIDAAPSNNTNQDEDSIANMNPNNQRIFEYLDYYCRLIDSPQYAILIRGSWGVGKTQFIKQFIDKRQNKSLKSLMVSTYGMSTFQDIEDEFFRLLHPRLSSKKAILTGKILKGMLKGTLKIDLNQDGRDDGTLSPTIPDINLPDYLTNLQDFVIIFDDLERSNIPILNLLGYINHLVEHGGHKVILIANEEEILKNDSSQENQTLITYTRAKEKLIGKTFEIAPEFDIALNAFIANYSDEHKRIIQSLSSDITRLYHQSLYRNLRHIKQAIDDFLRLIDALDETKRKNQYLLQALIRNYLIFSFETKSGSIQPNQLNELTLSNWISFTSDRKKEENSNAISIISKKYSDFSPHDLVLSIELWLQIFEKGVFDTEKLISEIDSCKYCFTEDTPTWKKLWYAYELSDEEINEYLPVVEDEFINYKHPELEVFLHIFGNLLFLSKCDIYTKHPAQILKIGKKYINHLKGNNLVLSQVDNFDGPFASESSYNLGYQERSSVEFQEIYEYLKAQLNKAVVENYPKVANDLVTLMDEDNFKFCQHLQLNNNKENLYYDTPILTYIPPRKFAEKFIQIPQRSKWNIGRLLENRYGVADFNKKLAPEAEWLFKVAKILSAEANKYPKSMKKRNLIIAAETFHSAAEHLKNHDSSNTK